MFPHVTFFKNKNFIDQRIEEWCSDLHQTSFLLAASGNFNSHTFGYFNCSVLQCFALHCNFQDVNLLLNEDFPHHIWSIPTATLSAHPFLHIRILTQLFLCCCTILLLLGKSFLLSDFNGTDDKY